MKIYPVILSGGSGTRLWPLSRAVLPKQLLPLVTDKTMLQETALRVQPANRRPAIAAANLRSCRRWWCAAMSTASWWPSNCARSACRRWASCSNRSGATRRRPWPWPRNTCWRIDPQALMLVLAGRPCHHRRRRVSRRPSPRRRCWRPTARWPPSASCRRRRKPAMATSAAARRVARRDGCYAVERFVEKPDLATAQAFLDAGNYFWNSGMFLFRAERYLERTARIPAAMLAACEAAVPRRLPRPRFLPPGREAFAACPSDSIDYAVMEHTAHAVVVPADHRLERRRFLVGAVGSAARVTPTATCCAATSTSTACSNSLVRAESRMVARDRRAGPDRRGNRRRRAGGAQGPGAARQAGGRAPEDRQDAPSTCTTRKVYRPWGCYEGIDIGERFQVKRITVKPGGKLSLQMHHHRAEHWVVVSGTARVTCGEKVTC